MKALVLVTALFFPAMSCTTTEEMQSCEMLAAGLGDQARDQILFSSCIEAISVECRIKDEDCQNDYHLQCIEAFLLLKASEVRSMRVQQCWK